uniref:ACB domain-containing protein n=1 Tax=Periophthalmus magnuspinnatus TaxID=409849 RepID=A0A3B4AT73_9GOBI
MRSPRNPDSCVGALGFIIEAKPTADVKDLRCYRPSYEVMLRFYSLYKQAVCGPCEVPRPGFWDPVGRYKWDAWNKLGEMERESAMAAYVDEMKNNFPQYGIKVP